MNRWFKWKTWNDQLALVLVVLIAGLWVADHWIQLPEEVIGATIVVFTLVAQFFYRRSPPTEPEHPA